VSWSFAVKATTGCTCCCAPSITGISPKAWSRKGEEPLAAAIREVREESTIEDLEFAWGSNSTQTGPYSGGKVARYYLASTRTSEVSLPINPMIGRAEHSEYRWVDFDAASNSSRRA